MPLTGEYQPSTWDAAREQVELYERSDGREGNTLFGAPVVILTTLGRGSGRIRKTPVMRVESGGSYALVASMGGAPSNPNWYHNVRACSLVELQDGDDRRDYVARELSGAERDEWWARAVEAFPAYGDYQASTSRRIPILLAEPVDPPT